VILDDDGTAPASHWSPREIELLSTTVELLRQNGYDGLTVDAVASAARASKATVYRRWPSKSELVSAAFAEAVRPGPAPAPTGSLRDDLIQLGDLICQNAGAHMATIRAVLVEVSRNPGLNQELQRHFVDQRRALMHQILQRAVERGEIAADAVHDELWDLLPGYLAFRFLIPGDPPTAQTVRALVDDIIVPSLLPRAQ